MAQTIQLISQPIVYQVKNPYSTHSEEPETKNDKSWLFSECDSLNNLCITLEKMNDEEKSKLCDSMNNLYLSLTKLEESLKMKMIKMGNNPKKRRNRNET